MRYEIQNEELTLTAESDSDQSILMNLWLHPCIVAIELPNFKFGVSDSRAKLTCIAPTKAVFPDHPIIPRKPASFDKE
jgi:hypothetical protein